MRKALNDLFCITVVQLANSLCVLTLLGGTIFRTVLNAFQKKWYSQGGMSYA